MAGSGICCLCSLRSVWHKPKAKHIQNKDLLQDLNLETDVSCPVLTHNTLRWFYHLQNVFLWSFHVVHVCLPGHPTQNELVAVLAEELSVKDQRSGILPSGGGEGRSSQHFSHLAGSLLSQPLLGLVHFQPKRN